MYRRYSYIQGFVRLHLLHFISFPPPSVSHISCGWKASTVHVMELWIYCTLHYPYLVSECRFKHVSLSVNSLSSLYYKPCKSKVIGKVEGEFYRTVWPVLITVTLVKVDNVWSISSNTNDIYLVFAVMIEVVGIEKNDLFLSIPLPLPFSFLSFHSH